MAGSSALVASRMIEDTSNYEKFWKLLGGLALLNLAPVLQTEVKLSNN